ncbi:MAG: CoA-binding protein [Bacillota bacterium]
MDSFFQDYKTLAVLGLSRNPKSFSRNAYDFLQKEGYQLYPVNPKGEDAEGINFFSSLDDVPPVEGAVFFTSPEVSKELISHCAAKNIRNLWFQLGSIDESGLVKARNLGLNAKKSCVFLHHPNSGFPHNIHRAINNLLGK